MTFLREEDMKIQTSSILARAVLLYRDEALEITVLDYYCLNKHSEMLKVCIKITEVML